MKKAILYARVSTARQEREGYSLRQQMEVLREYAAANGLEVVEEVEDGGFSGSTLERPGLDRARDLVAAGGVGLVLAQDADRITRDPTHRLLLDDEFAAHGCTLRALDDWGDDSHEGQLLTYLRSWMAKGERLKTAERSRRARRHKALEGKVVGGHPTAHGFAFTGDAYAVDEDAMETVRRIFSDVARGVPLRSLKLALDAEKVPHPSGRTNKHGWSRTLLKAVVGSDLYLPHTVDDLRGLGVKESVLAGLDARKVYGVYWYTGVAVPVPDAGITRETVLRARANLAGNKPPSSAGRRFWELSGGIIRCGECGRAMQQHSTTSGAGRRYFYYRCASFVNGPSDRCQNRKQFPAEQAERDVLRAALDAVKDKDELIRKAEEDFDRRRREIMRAGATDAATWRSRLRELEQVRLEYFRQSARGRLTDEQLEVLIGEADEQRADLERVLADFEEREARVKDLERQHARTVDLIRRGAWAELGITNPEKRHARYREIGLRAHAYPDGSLRVSWSLGDDADFGETENSTSRSASRARWWKSWAGPCRGRATWEWSPG